MPVEEHPAFPEWLYAFEKRKEAANDYNDLVKRNAPDAEINEAWLWLVEAEALYDKARDKIGQYDN